MFTGSASYSYEGTNKTTKTGAKSTVEGKAKGGKHTYT